MVAWNLRPDTGVSLYHKERQKGSDGNWEILSVRGAEVQRGNSGAAGLWTRVSARGLPRGRGFWLLLSGLGLQGAPGAFPGNLGRAKRRPWSHLTVSLSLSDFGLDQFPVPTPHLDPARSSLIPGPLPTVFQFQNMRRRWTPTS